MPKPNRPKAHHYVPQFYLRYFSTLRKADQYLLWCFDKQTSNIYNTNPKNAAQQIGFYEYPYKKGIRRSIEGFLANMDARFEVALNAVCRRPTMATVGQHKEALADFLGCQMLRTPMTRDNFLAMVEGANKKLADDGVALPIPSDDELRTQHVDAILNTTPLMAYGLQQLKWVFLHNATDTPFILADNPCFRYNSQNTAPYSGLGIASPGIQILTPLTPTLVLLMCDPGVYTPKGENIDVQPDLVEFINRGQVLTAQRYLFSDRKDFALAQAMIESNPKLADPTNVLAKVV
jgi:hypothetical protein